MYSYRRVAFHPERLEWQVATWVRGDDLEFRIDFDDGLKVAEIYMAQAEEEYVAKRDKASASLAVQEGGEHYKKLKLQPVEYIHANNIPFIEGCVIKYVTRWKDKGGVEDLRKARHFIDMLIELEVKK
jgi:hypothetical protein